MRYGRCAYCGHTIGWCTTEKGKQLALDVPANDAGNVFVRVIDGVLVGHVRHKGETPEGVCYMPHIATCRRKVTPVTLDDDPQAKGQDDMTTLNADTVECRRCGTRHDADASRRSMKHAEGLGMVCADRAACNLAIHHAREADEVRRAEAHAEQEQLDADERDSYRADGPE